MAIDRPGPARAIAVAALALGLLGGCALFADEPPAAPKSAQAVPKDNISALMRVAAATRAKGDLKVAIALYRRAHDLAPDRVEPLNHLGFTLREAGAPAQAVEAFRAALRLAPGDADALRGLGLALLAQNLPEPAVAPLEAALQVAPDARTYNALGVALDSLKRHARAQTVYREGLGVDPDNLNLKSNLGLSLALSGQNGEAIALLEQVVQSPNATANHRQNLALAYGLAGREDDARRLGLSDLDQAAVARNLATYQRLREVADTAAEGAAAE